MVTCSCPRTHRLDSVGTCNGMSPELRVVIILSPFIEQHMKRPFVYALYLVKSHTSCSCFISCMTSYLAAQTRTRANEARCPFRCDPCPTLQVHAAGSQMGGVCPPSYLSTPCDTTFSPCRVPEWDPVNNV